MESRTFFGWIFIVIGVLLAAGSGLCTTVFLVELGSVQELPLFLVLGGVPFLIGVGFFFLGRYVKRPPTD